MDERTIQRDIDEYVHFYGSEAAGIPVIVRKSPMTGMKVVVKFF